MKLSNDEFVDKILNVVLNIDMEIETKKKIIKDLIDIIIENEKEYRYIPVSTPNLPIENPFWTTTTKQSNPYDDNPDRKPTIW